MLIVPGKGKDTLVRLLNEANVLDEPLTTDNIVFGPPKVGSSATDTTVVVVPVLTSLYGERQTIQYPRLDLTAAYGDVRPVVFGLGAGDLHGMLPMLEEALGIDLDPTDIQNLEFDWLSVGGQVNVPIIAQSDSLSYIGRFTIEFHRVRPDLYEFVKNRDLPAFNWLTNPDTTRSLAMLTWSINFTENRPRLRNSGGRWFDGTYVADLMLSLGFAAWPSPTTNKWLKEGSPKDLGGNLSFDRVIVQPNVIGGDYAGDAYFHYNL